MGNRLLRREHVVAASLVGAVVVVVGYASGFGVRPVIGTEVPAGGGGGGAPTRPPAVAQPPTTTTAPAQLPGNGNRQVVPKATLPGTALPPAPVPTQPQHPHPTVPPPPSPPPTQPPPACVPGLVPAALDTLLQTIGRATDTLGPLLGGLLPIVTPPLDAATPGPLAQGPLDPLLGTCPPSVPPTQPTQLPR